MALGGIAMTLANIKPLLEMVQPILETIPESTEGKKIITNLAGNIEVNNVTFRYDPEGPPVLDNVSLKIRSGEYVAVVGKTGCGKSTLMRLLLGFPVPSSSSRSAAEASHTEGAEGTEGAERIGGERNVAERRSHGLRGPRPRHRPATILRPGPPVKSLPPLRAASDRGSQTLTFPRPAPGGEGQDRSASSANRMIASDCKVSYGTRTPVSQPALPW